MSVNRFSFNNWGIGGVALICIFIFSSALGFRSILINKAEKDIEILLQNNLNSIQKHYKEWTNQHIANAQHWPRNKQFRSHLEKLLEASERGEDLSSHVYQQDFNDLLLLWLRDHRYLDYYIIETTGKTIATSDKQYLGHDSHFFDKIGGALTLTLQGKQTLSKPFFHKENKTLDQTDQAVLMTLIPVFGPQGRVIAIFAVKLDSLSSFSKIFEFNRIGATGDSYAIDRHGVALNEIRFTRILQKQKIIPEDHTSTLHLKIKDPGVVITDGQIPDTPSEEWPYTELAQNLIMGQSGVDLEGYNDFKGTKVVGAWEWDNTNEIGFATEMSFEEAFSSLYISLYATYLYAFVSMIAVISFYVIIRKTHNKHVTIEETITKRQHLLERILASAGEGVYCLNNKGITTFVNKTARELLQYTNDELIGQPMHALIHHSHSDGTPYPRESCHMYKAFSDGQIHSISGEVLWRKDSSPLPVSYTSTPIWDNGELSGAVVVFRDSSKEIQAKKMLETAKDEAERANKAKSTFLSSMSHELRTPLNAILGFGQILQNDPKDISAKQLDYVNEIINGGKHLLSLINDVLELSKIDAGEMTLTMENIHPKDVIDASLSMVTMMAIRKGITIDNEVLDKEVPLVNSDFLRLKQTLINFLSNAIKYNRPKGKVTIDAEQIDKDYVRFSVTDTGQGIPSTKMDALWEPFNRMGAETTNIEGTGIGLSLTKSMVEILGGRIGVESTVGTGSTFWADIPLLNKNSIHAPKVILPRAKEISHKEIKTEPTGNYDFSDFAGLKILYIEDASSSRAVMRSIIGSNTGIKLETRNNGKESLESLGTLKPDLVILDINLPDIDGFEVKRRMNEHPSTSKIPVIALTANVNQETREKAMSLGFVGFLPKPIYIPDLYKGVSQIVLKQPEM